MYNKSINSLNKSYVLKLDKEQNFTNLSSNNFKLKYVPKQNSLYYNNVYDNNTAVSGDNRIFNKSKYCSIKKYPFQKDVDEISSYQFNYFLKSEKFRKKYNLDNFINCKDSEINNINYKDSNSNNTNAKTKYFNSLVHLNDKNFLNKIDKIKSTNLNTNYHNNNNNLTSVDSNYNLNTTKTLNKKKLTNNTNRYYDYINKEIHYNKKNVNTLVQKPNFYIINKDNAKPKTELDLIDFKSKNKEIFG